MSSGGYLPFDSTSVWVSEDVSDFQVGRELEKGFHEVMLIVRSQQRKLHGPVWLLGWRDGAAGTTFPQQLISIHEATYKEFTRLD